MLEKIKKMMKKNVILNCFGKSVIDNVPLYLENILMDEENDRIFIEVRNKNVENRLYSVYIDEIERIEILD